MKRQFVDTLQEGDAVNDYFVAIRCDLRDQAGGGKFLGMVFKDKTGEIGGILWNNAASIAKLFDVGDVVNVRGNVSSYQGRLQIRVQQVLPLREDEYDPADLVLVPETNEEVLASYVDVMRGVAGPYLSQLIGYFLDDPDFMARLSGAAAGKRWHHAYPGGLVEHCYEMVLLAEPLFTLYPSLNRDLVLAGIFFHDIGKIDEMTHDLMVDYTDCGKLLGHLHMGAQLVEDRIARIDGFPENLRLQLIHCILSHHGELENGSPIVPKTMEAMVLYHIDNLDAQVNAFSRITAETRAKEQSWSDFIPLIDRPIWTRPRE
jgi:3'-5' exoribonuclease